MKSININPKKILIATKNKDKFLIMSGLLKRLGLDDYEFINLEDLGIREDIEEKGTVLNRAKQKADFFKEIIIKKKIAGILAVLGIDDGLKLEGRKKIIGNSKETTDKILMGKIISAGDKITIIRACVLNFLEKNIQTACVTSIPYTYFGNKDNIRREEGKYVLDFVIGFLGSKKPLKEAGDEECLEYYFKHSKKGLGLLCEVLIKE